MTRYYYNALDDNADDNYKLELKIISNYLNSIKHTPMKVIFPPLIIFIEGALSFSDILN